LILDSEEVNMARLIPFSVPSNFTPPKAKGILSAERGKIIEFQHIAIRKSA